MLMEYALGELDPLKSQRVETHVERCDACRALLDEYAASFGAARDWDPEVPAVDLDRMVARLQPYMEPRPRRVVWWGAGVAAMAAAAAVAMFVLKPAEAPAPEPSPGVLQASRTMEVPDLPEPAEPAPPVVKRSQPTEHLRVVASEDWNGRVKQESPKKTRVKVTRGFAVMSFEGGRGRSLEIEAPEVSIEVVGTRFYVETHPGADTVVGVVSGKIKVRSHGEERTLEAGQAQAFGVHGPKPAEEIASTDHHADDFLDYEPTPPPAKPKPKPTKKVTRPKPKPAPQPDPMTSLLKAQSLVREGRHAAAAGIYTEALTYTTGEMQNVVRYERARLWALHLDNVEAAEKELAALASGRGEVAVQAALTLCELDRAASPCRSRACLEALSDRGIDEAQKTLQRWGLDRFECGS